MSLQKIKVINLLYILIVFFPITSFSREQLNVYIDDTHVEQDTFYPGCLNKLCQKKAKELKKHYLKARLEKQLKKKYTDVIFLDKPAGEKVLVVRLRTRNVHSGKDFVGFAVINITLGTAPVKMKYKFTVDLELLDDGEVVKRKTEEFYEKRKVSILSDTQKYKKDAAKKIARLASDFIE